jgi:hypothetical protein
MQTMQNKDTLINAICDLVSREALKKLVFSKPKSSEVKKISARLVSHRERRMLSLELSLPGDTVSHKNISEENIARELDEYIGEYAQINIISTLGDAEYRLSKKGKEILLGFDKLERKLSGEALDFERAIEALDKKKSYILPSDEPFLYKLGISSADGRVHDKRQGKYRQINRFLEYIDDIYDRLPKDGPIKVFDLCCGKSYLSFAVYHFLTAIKGREVKMLGVDLKRDVINWCRDLALELGFSGMSFEVGDIRKISSDEKPDMVISLHACDVATDIVIDTAIRLGAKVILSTPCCHRYLNQRIKASELAFVTRYPQLSNKLSEAITDAFRVLRLRAAGYSVIATELTDPENTPKNTLISAVLTGGSDRSCAEAKREYDSALEFILGENKDLYLKDF